jgi:hypothetical protein
VKLAKEELGIDLDKADADQFRQVLKALYQREIERVLHEP